MSDLNTEEFARMQREAKQRVVEMKNRSRAFADQMNQSVFSSSAPAGQPNHTQAADNTTKQSPKEPMETDEKTKGNQKCRIEAEKKDANPNEDLLLLCLFTVLKEDKSDPLLPLLLLTLL